MTARRRVLHAVVGLAAITALARLAGFARTTAFGREVGSGCVGSVYQTANYVPNIVFDIVAGGMLSALVVPVLAPALADGDRDRAAALLSALLNRVLLVLIPVAALVALLSGPITSALLGPQPDCPGAHDLATRMLVVFAPQIVFYGVGIVLGGWLTAAERFTWPALAPLVSSLVVIGAYLLYGAVEAPGRNAQGLSAGAELTLSVGTTLGVVVLAACLAPPAWRTGARWQRSLHLPADVARTVRRAAAAGAATLAAQEISTAVMIRLANSGTERGTLVVVTLSQTLFLLPWAVLSLPVATTSFPRLSADWSGGRHVPYADRIATSTAVIVLAAGLGTGLLIAVAEPAGIVLLGPGASALAAFAPTTVAFALGLLGWSMVALLGRALYASGHIVASAVAQVSGQLSVIVVDVVLSVATPKADRGFVLGLGNSIGVTLAAILLVIAGRRAGAFAHGVGRARAWSAALVGAASGAALGWSIGRLAQNRATVAAIGYGLAAAAVAAVAFVLVAWLIDRDGVRALVRLERRGRAEPAEVIP
jgi:putative peptidoglycan lipid II flippase